MPLESIVVEKLRHVGGKTYWEIKSKEVEVIGGARYVKLPRQGVAHGFARLCLEKGGAMQQTDKHWSLVMSRGYAHILEQRNLAQADSLMQAQHAVVPELFKAVVQRKAEKTRMSRSKLQEMKQHPDVLTISQPFELTLKRPVHERDDLVVSLDVDIISQIIEYIQAEGWENSLKRPADLPPGIIRRSKGIYPFQYVWKNADGKRSRHYARTLEGAILGTEQGPPNDSEPGSDAAPGSDGEQPGPEAEER